MHPHILKERLQDLGASSWLVLWIENVLSNRPQRVCVNGVSSDCIVLNSGLPHGCVLSLCFSLFTSMKFNVTGMILL